MNRKYFELFLMMEKQNVTVMVTQRLSQAFTDTNKVTLNCTPD